MKAKIKPSLFALCAASIVFTSCCPNKSTANKQHLPPNALSVSPLSILLAAQPGEARNAAKITRLQKQIREGKQTSVALEQMGWTYVSEARASFDPGYFKLVEQCGLALDAI